MKKPTETSKPVRTAGAVDVKMLELLVCPLSYGPLKYDADADELVSPRARLAYPVRDGIPIMLVSEARHLQDDE
ncbi:Trm112 family protein [Hoeflea sp.]|uniref:Trm112 family protein n=1 Tax=Hoeflea sp. TaxID=1940281 RepID=UPI0019CEF066|nr:Trm112 family protein [Hoeflea sp.]MBC7280224.1 Trm112 family protein [Hoeflea sp.]